MIKLVRLVSGEEILADVKETKGFIEIKNPLVMVPTGEGKIGVADYMPYSDIAKGTTIALEHVMFMVNPIDDFVNAHKERFGGIVTPTTNLVGIK